MHQVRVVFGFGVECEYDLECSKCHSNIGYFGYGYYDPCYKFNWWNEVKESEAQLLDDIDYKISLRVPFTGEE